MLLSGKVQYILVLADSLLNPPHTMLNHSSSIIMSAKRIKVISGKEFKRYLMVSEFIKLEAAASP